MCQIFYLNLDPIKNIFSYWQQVGGHGSRYPHKECVTTHLPNENVSKMDGAKDKENLYWIIEKNVLNNFQFVGGYGDSIKYYKVYELIHY